MLSPIEIRNQEFRRGVRGYNTVEVDTFMTRVAEEYEKLYQENGELKEMKQRLEFDMAKYKKLEETMNQALVMAQQTADDMKVVARKEADLMVEGARKRIREMFVVYEEILKGLNVYRSEIKSLIASQAELVDRHDRRLEELGAFFYSRDMKNLLEGLAAVDEESGKK